MYHELSRRCTGTVLLIKSLILGRSRCSCGFLKLPNEVLSIVPDVFFDRLKGYFVDDQFVGETPLANLAGAEAPSEEDQSNK